MNRYGASSLPRTSATRPATQMTQKERVLICNLGGNEIGGVQAEVRRFVGHAVRQRVAIKLIAVYDAEHGKAVAGLPQRVR